MVTIMDMGRSLDSHGYHAARTWGAGVPVYIMITGDVVKQVWQPRLTTGTWRSRFDSHDYQQGLEEAEFR
jgi:hypothetical protein